MRLIPWIFVKGSNCLWRRLLFVEYHVTCEEDEVLHVWPTSAHLCDNNSEPLNVYMAELLIAEARTI